MLCCALCAVCCVLCDVRCVLCAMCCALRASVCASKRKTRALAERVSAAPLDVFPQTHLGSVYSPDSGRALDASTVRAIAFEGRRNMEEGRRIFTYH